MSFTFFDALFFSALREPSEGIIFVKTKAIEDGHLMFILARVFWSDSAFKVIKTELTLFQEQSFTLEIVAKQSQCLLCLLGQPTVDCPFRIESCHHLSHTTNRFWKGVDINQTASFLTVLTHGELSDLTAFEAFPMKSRKTHSFASENLFFIPPTMALSAS